jgi:hypothetical protein
MRSELNDVRLIDGHLFRQLDEEETRTVETRLLLDNGFAENVAAQRTAHRLVRLHGRREDRRRLDEIYRQLLTETHFAHQIKTIFA